MLRLQKYTPPSMPSGGAGRLISTVYVGPCRLRDARQPTLPGSAFAAPDRTILAV